MNEAQAIARLKRGHIDGLRVLVEAYQEQAVRTAYLILRDRAAAEDVVQSAFIRVHERIGQFDATRPFAPWFLRIVANMAIKAARRAQRTVPLETNDEDSRDWLDRLPVDALTPDEIAEHADTADQLWALLAQLPPEQRTVIVLRYYADLKNVEIADDLGIPPGTVRWRLHAGLERLRGLLKRANWMQLEQEALR